MVTRPSRFVVAFLCGCLCGSSWLLAQDTRGPWQDAVRLIDSASPADITAAIDKLQPIVSADRTLTPPAAALTTLALCQLRQQDYAAATVTLERLTKLYTPTQQQARRGVALRIGLVTAIMRDDTVAADAAFKDLVRMVVAEQGDPIDLKLNAHLIGNVVGMLNAVPAKSPIPSRVLQIGNEQLLLSKIRGIATSYQASLEVSNERTEAIVANLARIDKEGIDAVAADLEQRQEKLKQRSTELKEQKELTGEVIRNTREQVEQNTQDIRQLARDINQINFKLRQPTPGHPGPKRAPPPPLPSPSLIPVDEYETDTFYDTIRQNGEWVRVPVTRQVRRSQSDIERDRDRIYRRMRDEYDRAMAEYRNYETTYVANLNSWMQEDQRRKADLNNEKAKLELKRSDLLAANKLISEDKKDSTKELRLKRTAAEQEEFEVEMLSIAVDAFRQGQPERAFRPNHFEPLNFTQERVLLQKL
jgi:hypothetical protein